MSETATQSAKARLMALRLRAGSRSRPPVPAPPSAPAGPAPLSLEQEIRWTFEQLHRGQALFNVPLALSFSRGLDQPALQRTLDELVARHEMLRTRYVIVDGAPTPALEPARPVEISHLDLSALPAAERDAAVRRHMQDEHSRPFDLAAAPLLRAMTLRLTAHEYRVVMTIHHIATDGWAMGIFYREFAALYRGFSAAPASPSPLPRPRGRYRDYAAWQRGQATPARLAEAIAHWREVASDVEPLDLVTDRPRPAARSFRGGREAVFIPDALAGRLAEVARREGVTPFVVLACVFQLLLSKLSGQDTVVLGAHMANRTRPESQDVMGLFANLCALRGDFAHDPGFRDALAATRDSVARAMAHQHIPFEWIASELGAGRDRSRNPLFQAAINMQGARTFTLRGAALDGVAGVDADAGVAKLDLELYIEPAGEGLGGFLEYARDLFDPGTARRIADRFVALLERALTDPGARVSQLSPLLPGEAERLLRDWNATDAPVGDDTVIARIAAQARATPAATAVTWADGEMTYGALDALAGRVAAALRARGVAADQPVGVRLPRSPELVVALLAVLMAGGAALPIDPEAPEARSAAMLRQADCRLVISADGWSCEGVSSLDLDTLQAEGAALDASPPAADLDALAYLIFTSGSTGAPKGVMVGHGALANNLAWMQANLPLGPGDRVLFKTPVSFDVFWWDILWPLAAGAAVVVAEPGAHRDPVALTNLLIDHQITAVQFVPSMMAAFLAEGDLMGCGALRQLISIGEALPPPLAAEAGSATAAALVNLYGPAEATLHCTAHTVAPGEAEIPIGRPIANTRAYVLDRHGGLAAAGARGELHIGGACLARGYVNAPELTAERFAERPAAPGERLYRTGDVASWDAKGRLHFHGRLDDQLKLRGVRIEAGEVEAALRALPGVNDAAVAVRNGPAGAQLAAFLVSPDPPDPRALRSRLKALLPDPMIPELFLPLSALPLSANGKLDRRALARLAAAGPARRDRVAPRTPLEAQVAAVLADLLGVDAISVDDDFFELGGHSLLVARAAARLGDALGREIDMTLLYEAGSVAQLAARLAESIEISPGPADGAPNEEAPG